MTNQSIWTPLRTAVFRSIWVAALVSNVGSWMHLVASQWQMTSLASSAALVGLVSSAGALPAFALALPAGALADVVDRRRLLLFAQGWQFATATLLGVLTVADVTTPAVLLGATIVLGVGASLGLPAFSAVTVELVDREQLPAAISLNSVSMTLSQAVGPALGGLLVAAIGREGSSSSTASRSSPWPPSCLRGTGARRSRAFPRSTSSAQFASDCAMSRAHPSCGPSCCGSRRMCSATASSRRCSPWSPGAVSTWARRHSDCCSDASASEGSSVPRCCLGSAGRQGRT